MILERGCHRVALRRLSKTNGLAMNEVSDVARQLYIELALREPPLCDVEGDHIVITDAGREALPPEQPSTILAAG